MEFDIIDKVIVVDNDGSTNRLPIASTITAGIAQFYSDDFTVADGLVKLVNLMRSAYGILPWTSTYNYKNEIVYYPDVGKHGAFVQSLKEGNLNKIPYDSSGKLNTEWWKDVINFNNISEEYFTSIKEVIAQAEAYIAEQTKIVIDAKNTAENASSNALKSQQLSESARDQASLYKQAAEIAKDNSIKAQQAAEAAKDGAELASINSEESSIQAQSAAVEAEKSAQEAKNAVSSIGTVYKPAGSINFANLPASPSAKELGYVYNIKDAFTTDNRFEEGKGIKCDAGTNVAVIESNGNYKYDIYGGMLDLSSYAKNDGTYPAMSVGNADNVKSKINNQALSNIFESDNITVKRATNSNKLGGIGANKYVTDDNLGLIEKVISIPTPTDLSRYILIDATNNSAYVRKFYDTSNVIYSPDPTCKYYAIIKHTGDKNLNKYRIIWSTKDFRFEASNSSTVPAYANASIVNLSHISNYYNTLNEAENAIHSASTTYNSGTYAVYHSVNTSFASGLVNPILKTNYNKEINYVTRINKPATSGVSGTYETAKINPYNPVEGYIEGSVKNEYSKLLDSNDESKFATTAAVSELQTSVTNNTTKIENLYSGKDGATAAQSAQSGYAYYAYYYGKEDASAPNGTGVSPKGIIDNKFKEVDSAIVTKYVKPSTGIPESDINASLIEKINNKIEDNAVIVYSASLPTASSTSPDFVEINGVLYRKKKATVQPTNGKLEGKWKVKSTLGSFSTAFDTGISKTAIGYIVNSANVQTQIYGARYSSNQLWLDDDPNYSSGTRGISMIDTDEDRVADDRDVVFNSSADSITNNAQLLNAMQAFYTKVAYEKYSYEEVRVFNPNGTYTGITVGKAVADGNNRNIVNTYATKSELNAKYTKPSTGIPETDLSQTVRDKLSREHTIPVASPAILGGVKPVAKTAEMTQSVGIDANGALFTANALTAAFPVGAYYITESETTPSQLFGGKWVQVKDRFILGATSNSYLGREGGVASVTLTVDQIPSHAHKPHDFTLITSARANTGALQITRTNSGHENTNEFVQDSYKDRWTSYTGGGQSHTNIPPYRIANIWRRVE